MKTCSRIALIAVAAANTAMADEIPTYSGDEIVVTATRFQTRRETLPAGVEVLTQKEIAQSTASTLPELLSHLAGIHTRDNSGTPDAQIDMRGFGITGNQNTLVLLDGQRLSEIELVSPKWSAIPLSSIERIEILKGSGAVLYGNGATGGTINIITKSPRTSIREASVSAGFGSYGTSDLRAGFSIGTPALGMTMHANQLASDNYRVNNAIRQKNIETDIRGDAGIGNWVLKLGADDQSLRLPAARTESQLVNDRRGTSTPDDYSTRSGGHVNAGTTLNLGGNELAADLAYRERNATAFYAAFGGYNSDTKVNVLSFTPRLKMANKLFDHDNTLIAGLDWDDWDYDSKNTYGRTLARQKNQAVYFQDTAQLGELTQLALGVRVQHTENRVGAQTQTRSPHAYELALRHHLSPAVSVYAKTGMSFRNATIDENNSQVSLLEPQTSHEQELGIEQRNGQMSLRAALYQISLNNEISFIPSAPPFGANINLPPTERRGIELEATWKAAGAVELFANYTYAEARFRDGVFGGVNVAGKDVPLVPKHALNLGASWRLMDKTRLDGDLQYVGEQRFDNDQGNTFSRKMPGYTVFNAKLTHETGNWLLSAAVKNLLNEKYFSYGIVSGSSYNAYPAAGRTFFASAEYRFK